MTRRSFLFPCDRSWCTGTLDLPPAGAEPFTTGLLIVTGGNELRSGPHGSQAAMAAHFANLGFPTFRYDRRGVGDSRGDNGGWRNAEADLHAAVQAFQEACPMLSAIVGFGNCDGASSLTLYGRSAGLSCAVLANPWAFDHDGESTNLATVKTKPIEHSRASTLRYYRQRLGNPVRLLTDLIKGKVNMANAVGDLSTALAPSMATKTAIQLSQSLLAWGPNAKVLLAESDRTALYFQEQMATLNHALTDAHICPTASHSFADDAAREWLYQQIKAALIAP